MCSRRLDSVFLHANNLLRVVEREELLALLAAVLHTTVVRLILLADFRPHEPGVHADIDGSQSIDAVGLKPSTHVAAFGNAAARAHVGRYDGFTFFGVDLADVPDFKLLVPDGG